MAKAVVELSGANQEMGSALKKIAEHLGFVGTAAELASAIEEQIEHLRLTADAEP